MSLYIPQDPYLTDRAIVIDTELGLAVCAAERIERLELVAVFGGIIISGVELDLKSDDEKRMTLQVGEDEFSFSIERHPSDFINHSCDPNLGFDKDGNLRAMQDIEPDIELVFDYSMADSTPYDQFGCLCRGSSCRHSVTGDDWKITELRQRYRGWFMPYLQAKIDAEQAIVAGQELS